MLHRLLFLAVAAFFITMNVLLWRTEFGSKTQIRSTIPVEKVWQKILSAPDNSSLDIFHHGKKIGYCVWSVNTADPLATVEILAEDYDPDAFYFEPSSHTLKLDGNLSLESFTNNVRFDLSLNISTNHTWQEMRLHVSMRPNFWELTANAEDETLKLVVNDESGLWEDTYTFAELQDPDALLREFGGPMAVGLMRSFGLRSGKVSGTNLSLGLKWEAYNDWMKFGHSRDRVYRLEAKLLDRLKIYVFVSRVGEILWVHLPDEIVLSSGTFAHF